MCRDEEQVTGFRQACNAVTDDVDDGWGEPYRPLQLGNPLCKCHIRLINTDEAIRPCPEPRSPVQSPTPVQDPSA